MEEELKPCPFCGEISKYGTRHTWSHVRLKDSGGGVNGDVFVDCSTCGARGPDIPYKCPHEREEAEADAVAAWNRRVI